MYINPKTGQLQLTLFLFFRSAVVKKWLVVVLHDVSLIYHNTTAAAVVSDVPGYYYVVAIVEAFCNQTRELLSIMFNLYSNGAF